MNESRQQLLRRVLSAYDGKSVAEIAAAIDLELEKQAFIAAAAYGERGTPEALALYIEGWLESRNREELRPAIEAMTLESYRGLLGELAMILRHGGKPPNWGA